MPADADLLCEYFISSNLNSKKFKSQTQSPTKFSNQKLKFKSNSESNLFKPTIATNQDNSSFFNDQIDFIKYDKNPMDYLKNKYQLLNTLNKPQQQQLDKTKTVSLTNLPNQSNENKQQQQLRKDIDLNWSKIQKIGIGLLNLGNNCYLNATLQCLAYTPPLSQWLITKPHSPGCKFRLAKGFCALCEVERIIFDIFNSANGFAKPNSLCYNIKKISNVFGVGTQEDASEFFTTLLESMAKSIKFSLNSFNPQNCFKSDNNNKKVNTILDDIFSFQFRSRITCSNCGRLSDTIENTNSWPVDVKYVQDIRKGMLHFLREEVLDGENAYKCEKCNKKTKATKKYSIRTAPNVLVVHLKRFDFSYAGKLSHFVTYPEFLSLKTFIPETILTSTSNGLNDSNKFEKSLRDVTYKLYGVLVHLGYTSHSGHYYSYVRGPTDSWYKADDQRISLVQSKDALTQNAYLLFYSKISNLENSSETKTQSIQSNSVNIPHMIKTETSPSHLNSSNNYLNSLNTSKSLLNDNNDISVKNETRPIYGPTLPPQSSLKLKLDLVDNSVEKSSQNKLVEIKSPVKMKLKKKNLLKFSKKKLKKLISELKTHIKIETSLTKNDLIKNRRKLKKLKKALKEKKQVSKLNTLNSDDKKLEITSNENINLNNINNKKRKLEDKEDCESNVSVSSLSSLSSTKSTSSNNSLKKLKTKTEEPNGLTLLKQYHSSSSASPSPEPSPTHSISSSVSSMSTTSIKSNNSIKKESSQIIYSYNSSCTIPSLNNSSLNNTSSNIEHSNVLNDLKQSSSLSSIKTWSSNLESELNTKKLNIQTRDELDEYNNDFDKPFVKESKLKHNSKKYQSPYSGFHVYTHSNNSEHSSNRFNYNQNWSNRPLNSNNYHQTYKYNNYNNSNNNRSNNQYGNPFNRPKTFNVFHKR